MSTTAFYVAARRAARSADVRALMVDLLKRARARDRLQAEFSEQVLANRTRREGKPFNPSKAARDFMREAAEDARKAAEGQAQRIAKLSGEQLLWQALNGWDFAIQLHRPDVCHEDDRAFAERIDRHNKNALRTIKAFYRTHGMPVPPLSTAICSVVRGFGA